jgi:GNAT superfamily N-acetyltransferase
MLYREAVRADAAAIARLHAESWQKFYRGAYRDEYLDGPIFDERLAVWEERMTSPPGNQFVVLAEERGALAGFACAYGAEHERWGTLLDNLHISAHRHRGGIGRQLVVEVAGWCCRAYPECGMYLGVLAQNARAQAFYRAIGGIDVGGDSWEPPGGGTAELRLYAWTIQQLADMSPGATLRR